MRISHSKLREIVHWFLASSFFFSSVNRYHISNGIPVSFLEIRKSSHSPFSSIVDYIVARHPNDNLNQDA
jgi:hypothetical protein